MVYQHSRSERLDFSAQRLHVGRRCIGRLHYQLQITEDEGQVKLRFGRLLKIVVSCVLDDSDDLALPAAWCENDFSQCFLTWEIQVRKALVDDRNRCIFETERFDSIEISARLQRNSHRLEIVEADKAE